MNEELTKLRDKLADEFLEKYSKDQKMLYKPKIACRIAFCEGWKAGKKATEDQYETRAQLMENWIEEMNRTFGVKK